MSHFRPNDIKPARKKQNTGKGGRNRPRHEYGRPPSTPEDVSVASIDENENVATSVTSRNVNRINTHGPTRTTQSVQIYGGINRNHIQQHPLTERPSRKHVTTSRPWNEVYRSGTGSMSIPNSQTASLVFTYGLAILLIFSFRS